MSRRRQRRNEELSSAPLSTIAIVGVLMGGGFGWLVTSPLAQRSRPVEAAASPVNEVAAALKPEPRPFRRFSGCYEARAAGYENITADEPSYRADWDGDGDGIACEPHR